MPLFRPPNPESLKTKGDVKGLIKALHYKKDWEVRIRAAEALGMIGDPRAIKPLTDALKDKKPDVRECAAKALDKLGWSPNISEAGAAYWITKRNWDKCVEIGRPAVKLLINTLKDENSDVRECAAEALGMIGDKRATIHLIIVAIHDANYGVRSGAAEALHKIRDRMTIEHLSVLLKHGNARAAETLGMIGDPRAIKPLTTALTDKNPDVRKYAFEALHKIRDVRAHPTS